MKELIDDLNRVYGGIQNLDVQPTKKNTAIILDTLTVIESSIEYVMQHEKGEHQDGNNSVE